MELRYRATLEYDGTNFQGFQIQSQGRTIQGELEKTIERVTGRQVRVLGAGRTDAGVHATGQVIAFDVFWRHSVPELHRALNAVLPEDIAITQLTTTYAGFHPRFDAKWRQYRYTILNQPVRSPLWARSACHVAERLDVEAMQEASQTLVGSHDFAAFGRPPQGENTVRHVLQAGWRTEYPGHIEGKLLIFEIRANAFLFRMVRNIVGTLLRVGRGEFPPDQVAALLESQDRAASGPPVPACGLCLVKVSYADSE
ncbi:MAG: tRNA pseudouridine(38-40) synthase TruA [Anaerolineae bacterium]